MTTLEAERSPLRINPVTTAIVILGAALVAWIVIVDRMRGMDAGPGKRDPIQVIGVVKDAKYEALNQAASFKTAYLAGSQDAHPWPGMNFEIRSSNPTFP